MSNSVENFEGETLEKFIERVHGEVFPGVEAFNFSPPKIRNSLAEIGIPDDFVMFLFVTTISSIAVVKTQSGYGLRRIREGTLDRWFCTNKGMYRRENPLFANALFYDWFYSRYGIRADLVPIDLIREFFLFPVKPGGYKKPSSWLNNPDDIAAIQRQLDSAVSKFPFIRFGKKRYFSRECDNDMSTAWDGEEELYERFSGKITGIKRRNIKSAGDLIYVRVPLIKMPYEEQVRFVKDNKADIIDYIMSVFRENASNKSWAKVSGMIKFCDVTDITVLRSSEIEVIFSLKKNVFDALSS